MKKITKRTLSLLLAAAMLIGLLAGCGNNDTPDTDTPDEDEAPVSEQPTTGNSDYPITPEELGAGDIKWSETETDDGWNMVENTDGATLGYSPESGVQLIQVEGYAFKDLNGNGVLDLYEDWRQDADSRAADLSSVLTPEEAAGLMIHASIMVVDENADNDKELLDDGARALLSFAVGFPAETQAKWNNAIQAYVEASAYGIPVSISTNPRTTPVWPSNLAQSASFNPELVLEISKGLSKDYRALGITTLLGPQIDLATEPRWSRVEGTFGEDPALSRDMTNAAVSGHQSTYDASGNDLGWGDDSVNAMIKHWPGDGPGQSGRESHDEYGQFTVYPGGQFDTHLIPFVDGGLNPDTITGQAVSAMDSYGIAWSEDGEYGELVGSAFSEWKNDLLQSYGFEGYICSDWGVVGMRTGSTGWGMDTGWGESVADMEPDERCLVAIMNGTDQIGGLNDVGEVISAYNIGVSEYGEEAMLARYQEASGKILKSYFQIGLFENAYVSVSAAKARIGGEEATAEGYEAQLQTVVMLKNEDETIKAAEGDEKPTVYVPFLYIPGSFSTFGGSTPATAELPIDRASLDEYFNVVTDTLSTQLTGPEDEDGNPTIAYEDIIRATPAELADVDYAFVIAKNPRNLVGGVASPGYDPETDKIIPISLQYGEYVANGPNVRTESIAGATIEAEVANPYGVSTMQEKMNMSYYGETAVITNSNDLDMILYAAENVPDSAKVIVAIDADNAMVFSEFESKVDAILMGFAVNYKTFLDIAAGRVEPSALLPMQQPADMDAVEAQLEDVPRDMECYVDASGNTYDFAFGLNWSGIIKDARTEKYDVPALVSPQATPAG